MDFKSPKAFLIFYYKINSKQQNKSLLLPRATERLQCSQTLYLHKNIPFISYILIERQMSRKRMWEPQY